MDNSERAEVIRRVTSLVENDPERSDQIRTYAEAARPIVNELAELGYHIDSLADLRHQGRVWKSALPTLLRWLPLVDEPGVKEDIIRCLSVPWIGNEATARFIEEFKESASRCPIMAWTIGNALSVVGVGGFEDQIIELAANPAYGVARQMIVMRLDRLGNSHKAEEVALNLLEDPDVKLHAVIALGKMKSKRSLPELKKLLTDKKTVIRREARKAIAKIMQ